MANNDYAVVVGISRYSYLDPLGGPENDATDFKNWLISPSGGALPPNGKTIQLVLSGHFPPATESLDEEPTLSRVISAFAKIKRQVSANPPGRRLYIFMAGHGITPQNDLDEVALLMANADLDNPYTLPGRKYVEWFRAAALFQEVVLFMDCCRDNVSSAPLHGPYWLPEVREDARHVKCYFGLATEWSRKSRERPFDRQGQPRIDGLFSRSVVSVLNTGRVTWSQFRNLVINHMQSLRTDGVDQTPELAPNSDSDFVFSEHAHPIENSVVSIKISFGPAKMGHRFVIQGVESGRVKTYFDPYVATAVPWRIDLRLGMYSILDMDDGHAEILHVTGGDTQDVRI